MEQLANLFGGESVNVLPRFAIALVAMPSGESLLIGTLVVCLLLALLLATATSSLEALSGAVLHALDAGESNKKISELAASRARTLSRAWSGLFTTFALAQYAAASLGARTSPAYAGVWALTLAATFGVATLMISLVLKRVTPQVALRVFHWTALARAIVWPLSAPTAWVVSLAARAVPQADVDADVATRAVEHMIERGEQAGSIEEEHAELLYNMLEFKDTIAKEVMVPRTNIVALQADCNLRDAMNTIAESEHSRYPVFAENIDDIDAVAYAKDLFPYAQRDALDVTIIRDVARPGVFVAQETKKIGELLREMQASRIHMAVVVDEFGGTAGIVTLEDILEEIVGEIVDEHDAGELAAAVESSPGVFKARGDASIYDVESIIGVDFGSDKGDFDSLGGLMVAVHGGMPDVGTSIVVGGYELMVLDADERRIAEVELTPLPGDAGESITP